MGKIKKEEFFSIPNCMGYFRILLIPFFCVIYLKADSMKDYYLAAGIVAISTITDFLDGKVARKFHMITEFGKFLDPLADKLTHGAIALCLAFRYEAMRYLVALMLVKEGFMADKPPSWKKAGWSKMVWKSVHSQSVCCAVYAGAVSGDFPWGGRNSDLSGDRNYGGNAAFVHTGISENEEELGAGRKQVLTCL